MTCRMEVQREEIFFTTHALDRWWDRWQENETGGRKDAMEALRRELANGRIEREQPEGLGLSLWHRARAWGYIVIGDGAFVVNRGGLAGSTRDLVATTFVLRRRSA